MELVEEYSILELKICEQQYESIKIENEEEVARYYKLKKKLELVQEQMSVMMNEPKYLLPFLQPGRLVTVCDLTRIFDCSSISSGSFY
jgi:hypothetical protein